MPGAAEVVLGTRETLAEARCGRAEGGPGRQAGRLPEEAFGRRSQVINVGHRESSECLPCVVSTIADVAAGAGQRPPAGARKPERVGRR